MNVSEIDIEMLDTLGTTDIQLVDVREIDEFEEARVPGARLIPLATLPERISEMDPSRDLYLICASGGRSLRAAEWLGSQGFTTINISGGTNSWVLAGKPFISGTAEV